MAAASVDANILDAGEHHLYAVQRFRLPLSVRLQEQLSHHLGRTPMSLAASFTILLVGVAVRTFWVATRAPSVVTAQIDFINKFAAERERAHAGHKTHARARVYVCVGVWVDSTLEGYIL